MADHSKFHSLIPAVKKTLLIYGLSTVFALFILWYSSLALRLCFLYICGLICLISAIASFMESRISGSYVKPAEKAVFITGCDSGFGYLLAQRLDKLGLQVFAGCLLPDGDGAAKLEKSTSSKCHIVPLDVTSDESIEGAVEYVTNNLNENKLWAVVNNAGLIDGGELLWTNNDIIKKNIDVNTFGVLKVTKAFLLLLMKSKGRVITVASAGGRFTFNGVVPYCMSKHAVVSFCDGLRLEMYNFGVDVVTIEPLLYRTPISSDQARNLSLTKTWETAPPEVKRHLPDDYIEKYLIGTTGLPDFFVSNRLQDVVDCLEEGVMAVSPKYYYRPGKFWGKFMFWLFQNFPKPIVDLMLKLNS